MNKVSLFEVALTDRRVKQPQYALGIRYHVWVFFGLSMALLIEQIAI